MFLKRLEIQGFKTFAQKTILEFLPDASGRRGMTAIVGPNGSGKSNTADALRWVMGEQSLKLLRGKKSEDVIFSGSDKRARSGFAEVTMLLERDPSDKEAESELTEIAITRRLYRDGQSEYEVNRQPARLQDVALLLAQSGIGQRTYSVIGQGMVDHVLVASPTERKEFFDEAFGLRPFQLKRQSAVNKIEDAKENLVQTEALLREIEPRLVSLERQARRLQERDGLERELRELERRYYGHAWHDLKEGMRLAQSRLEAAKVEQMARESEAKTSESELVSMEKEAPVSEGFRELRRTLDALSAERNQWRERQLKLETRQAVAAVRAEKPWTTLPLSKIIETVGALNQKYDELDRLLQSASPDLDAIRRVSSELRACGSDLLSKLQRPAPEPEQTPTVDPELEREALEIAEHLAHIAKQTAEAEEKLEAWNQKEEGNRKYIFEVQHRLNQKRAEAQAVERRASEAAVELARFETRRDAFLAEVREHAPTLEEGLDALGQTDGAAVPSDAPARMQRLRSQLEWIGGIDPETLKEYETTKERHGFLAKQTEDLRSSLGALSLVVDELDTTIRERSETAFRKLNHEFGIYFKKLFNGGDAQLVEVHPEPEVDEEGNEIVSEEDVETVSGIEIQATPPGKRFKSIALLSGGERALTSIALICAIMATNPSPFVVLDEVDAALDEANSRKFAEIIASLADKTQFIVVSHNRATMQQANVLYGVTMRDDGVSQLISVKMEDVERMRKGS